MNKVGKRSLLFLDIETNSKASQIWLAVTKDAQSGEIKCHHKADTLLKLLEDKPLLVAHNGIGFDFPVLNRLWNTKITPSMCVDTLVISRLMNPNRENGHSLEAWGNSLGKKKIDYKRVWHRINKLPYDKHSSLPFDQPHPKLLERYCVRDVEVLEQVYYSLLKEQQHHGFSQESIDLEHKVAIIIAKQERNGFRFDLPKAMVLLAGIKDKMADIEASLQSIFPPIVTERYSDKTGKRLKDDIEVFNPGSRQQIAKRLIEKGWQPTKHTEKGQVIVDESTLADVDIDEAKVIAEYLLLQKRSAQIESWIESCEEDTRIRGRVITNGAVTGRATHHSPNIAQVPNTGSAYGKECRELFVCDEGNVIVGCDLSGIELRCLAHYMQDEEYTEELLNGDIHTRNQKAADLPSRNIAKTFCYSILYGAGPSKVATIIGGTTKDGQRAIDNFLRNTPSLQRLKQKVERLAEKGYVPALDGRKIWVRSQHSALNSLLQSAGAIISKQWIIQISRNMLAAKVPYKQLAWIHDEVEVEVAEQFAEKTAAILVQSANEVQDILKFRVRIDAEAKIGKTWYDVH
jgi:DNA polymerase-1